MVCPHAQNARVETQKTAVAMRSVQTAALSHARNTSMSLPNFLGVKETELSDQPSLRSEAFHSPSASATPPPCGQSLGMRATGKENHWRGASITNIGILLCPTHTYLGRDLTHGPHSTSSSASCMRHALPSKRHQQSPEHGVLLRTRTLPSKKRHIGWYRKLGVSTASEIRFHFCEQMGNCEHRKRWPNTC